MPEAWLANIALSQPTLPMGKEKDHSKTYMGMAAMSKTLDHTGVLLHSGAHCALHPWTMGVSNC